MKRKTTKKRKGSGLMGLDQPLFLTQKEATNNITNGLKNAIGNAIGGIGSSLLLQNAKDKIQNDKTRQILAKFGGAITFGVGTAGKVFANNEFLDNVASGLCTVGGIQIMFDQNVSFAQKLAVANPTISTTADEDIQGLGVLGDLDQDEMDEILRQIIDEDSADHDTEPVLSGVEEEVEHLFK